MLRPRKRKERRKLDQKEEKMKNRGMITLPYARRKLAQKQETIKNRGMITLPYVKRLSAAFNITRHTGSQQQ